MYRKPRYDSDREVFQIVGVVMNNNEVIELNIVPITGPEAFGAERMRSVKPKKIYYMTNLN
jgi:hypothetical protein